MNNDKVNLAYIIGVAIGDGNLSNPNGRAVRLRVTCDFKYPNIIERISSSIHTLLPTNKVSMIKRAATYCDISCYSNKWEKYLGWKAKNGSKFKQNVSIPRWIIQDKQYYPACLRGLLETDGSIYLDRGYKMVNFVSNIPNIVKDVMKMFHAIGFHPKCYKIKSTKYPDRFTVRLSKDVEKFINTINFKKN